MSTSETSQGWCSCRRRQFPERNNGTLTVLFCGTLRAVDLSPFPYQGPLEPDQVAGRDELVGDLVGRLADHRVTVLLGPRRYGKTSVLRRVLRDLERGGATPVWVDLYALTSLADLAARLDDGLDAVRGPLREVLTRIASSMSLQLGGVKVDLRSGWRERPDPALTVQALLDVLVRAGSAAPLVVAFDEFAGISGVPGAAGMIRTALQHHYQQVGLVFAGSEPSMMRTLFTAQAEPFYGQADLVEIGPLPERAVVDIVIDGFTSTGRGPGPIPDRVGAFAGGHPQRSMQLADAAWRATPAGSRADDGTWELTLEQVRADVAGGLERLHSALPVGQQKVLRALAHTGSIYGSAARTHDLPKGTATSARAALLDHGHVREHGGRTVIVDPLLADWLRHRFPL